MFPQDRAYDTAAPEFGFDGRLQPGMALDALANQVGWHLIDYPETKAHAPFVALAAGLELGGLLHAWTLGAELHLPFDYLKFDVRFPSVLALVRVAL